MALAASCRASRWAAAAWAWGTRIKAQAPALPKLLLSKGRGCVGHTHSKPHAGGQRRAPWCVPSCGSWASRQAKPRPFEMPEKGRDSWGRTWAVPHLASQRGAQRRVPGRKARSFGFWRSTLDHAPAGIRDPHIDDLNRSAADS